jgi:hypothetical protein
LPPQPASNPAAAMAIKNELKIFMPPDYAKPPKKQN